MQQIREQWARWFLSRDPLHVQILRAERARRFGFVRVRGAHHLRVYNISLRVRHFMGEINALAFFKAIVVLIVEFSLDVFGAITASGALFIDKSRLHVYADGIVSRLAGHIFHFRHGQ
jgi:hypothetical protein